LFDGAVPLEFPVPFIPNTDEDSIFLTPQKWDDLPAWAKARAGRESSLVNAANPRNTWAAIAFSMGIENFQSNEFVRMMRHYIDVGKTLGKNEPIISIGEDMSTRDAIDSTTGQRIHLLMMGVWSDLVNKLDHELVKEVVVNMFRDPNHEAQFVKSKTSILKQLVFSRSTRGDVVKWSPLSVKTDPLKEFSIGKIEDEGVLLGDKKVPFNDSAYYGAVAEKVLESLAELRKKGYNLLADKLQAFCSPEVVVTRENLAAMAMLNSIEAMVGFTRGEKIQSFKKQIKKEGSKPVNPGYLPEMSRHINAFVDWAAENGRFPTEREWKERLHTALNSNSAGGPRAKYRFKLDGETVEFSASDKLMVFLQDPMRWISAKEFDKSLTKLFPGGITSRDVVGGRDTRAVWMIALVIYLYETIWGYAELDFLTQVDDEASFGEVGLAAHKAYIYNTSVMYIFNVLKDFSSYDTTQEWENARGPFAKLMVEAMNAKGLTENINGMGTIPEIYLKVAHKLRDAVFDLGNGELVNPQQTHSGELNTANRNTILNKSEDDYEERVINERYPDLREVIGPRDHRSVLGDDSIKDYQVSKMPTVEDHVAWGEAIQNAATECGFEINRFKTVRRTAYGEYLKVLYIYGHMIPQLGRLMPFSSERTNTLMDPIESMRGVVSFLRTLVARGAPHEFCLRYGHHLWNIRRGVRTAFFRSREARAEAFNSGKITEKFIDYPFAVYWTPQSLGGVGELPFTMMGASKDALIYVWGKEYPGMLDVINEAAHALDYGGQDINREIAKQIEASGEVKPYEDWLNENVLDNTRRLRMTQERDRFPGIQLGDMEYQFSARRRILQTLRGASKVNALSVQRKVRQSKQLAARLLEPVVTNYMQNLFGWMDSLNFSSGALAERIQDVAVVIGRDPSVERLELVFGFSTVGNDQRERISKLFKVMNDNRFNPEAEFGFDTLIQLFTRPDIYPVVERIASVAVRIGSEPLRAMRFAEQFVTSFDAAIMIDKGQQFSSGDELSMNLDLSFARLSELIDIPVWIGRSEVSYLARQVSVMKMLTTPINKPIRKVVVQTFGDAESEIMSKLNPRFHSPNRSYMLGIPVNSWY
jgi:hypothetical protein